MRKKDLEFGTEKPLVIGGGVWFSKFIIDSNIPLKSSYFWDQFGGKLRHNKKVSGIFPRPVSGFFLSSYELIIIFLSQSLANFVETLQWFNCQILKKVFFSSAETDINIFINKTWTTIDR